MREDYNTTCEVVRDILTPYNITEIKAANKAMKKIFGSRLSQIHTSDSATYTYYILCKEYDEWHLIAFRWDYFYGMYC